jgi:hypothetical protein
MKYLLFIVMMLCCIATSAQRTATQTITTDWGKYVNTELYAHGNTILQVNVEGQNCAWHGHGMVYLLLMAPIHLRQISPGTM